MAHYQYERLSAQDNAFLLWETPSLHMHVATTNIMEAGPLEKPSGGIDFASIKRAIRGILPDIPRYRQRLAFIPRANHAVWVDDEHFDLDFHVRHTSLPKPGSDAQLKKLAARLMAQQLDRTRPLWELWVIEGLNGNRFAMFAKMHHCMVDGMSGMDLMGVLYSESPDAEIREPDEYLPRPAPSDFELWRDDVQRRVSLPANAVRSLRERQNLRDELSVRWKALRSLMIDRASDTPFNGTVGPHRLFDWTDMPLAKIKEVKNALGCTVNDVVLTIATGAFRDFLIQRGVRPDELQFQVQAPVSTRGKDDDGRLGNKVSNWTVPLPVGEADPIQQLDAIHETTSALKESQSALGIETINTIAEWTTSSLLSLGVQASHGTTNSLVTNVPGPQYPLYFLGARQLGMYPLAPLLANVGLVMGLVSYDGKLCWGFNADLQRIPDLDRFVQLVDASFERLAGAAGVKIPKPRKTPGRSGQKKRRSRRPREAAAAPSPPPSQ